VKLGHRLVVGDREGKVDVLGRRTSIGDECEGAVVHPDVEPPLPVVGHLERESRGDGLPEASARSEIPDTEPEVVDRRPADAVPEPRAGLDAVSVGIEEEPAVVVRVVLRAQSGLPVARIARVDARPPERVDFLA
jgi:hypothetical protein